MKRALVLLGSLCVLTGVLRAADAVAIATQQEAEERYKRLTATVEEFQTSQMAQQKQIGALASDLSKLREEVAHNNNSAAMQESIRRLNEQILKVDESRIADNKRIQEALEKLGRAIEQMSKVGPPPRPRANAGGDTGANPTGGSATPRPPAGSGNNVEEFFPYVVQSGDRLDLIVKAYRARNFNVTSKSIMDANPTVDWSRLKIGQQLFIPKPK